jgi:hypothetical protein
MKNRFEKYVLYVKENGKIINVNRGAFELAEEAFELFKQLYNTHYGSIHEDGNLVSIHTGGWSDNEELIREFKETGWWILFHKISANGGHYYFDLDIHGDKEWKIIKESVYQFVNKCALCGSKDILKFRLDHIKCRECGAQFEHEC